MNTNEFVEHLQSLIEFFNNIATTFQTSNAATNAATNNSDIAYNKELLWEATKESSKHFWNYITEPYNK